MEELQRHTGAWSGTNGFRLTPDEEPHVAPSSAEVSIAAAGLLVLFAYRWSHAQDGEQSGLLILGRGEDEGAVAALWCDPWHQPAAKSLTGTADNGLIRLSYTYAGDWQWVIALDATDPDSLRVRMDNVVPESAAAQGYPPGDYWAMSAELSRSS